jgi:hypothetical protein
MKEMKILAEKLRRMPAIFVTKSLMEQNRQTTATNKMVHPGFFKNHDFINFTASIPVVHLVKKIKKSCPLN